MTIHQLMGQPRSSDRRTKQPSWKEQSAKAGPFLEDRCRSLLAGRIPSPWIFFLLLLHLTTLTLAQAQNDLHPTRSQSNRSCALWGEAATFVGRFLEFKENPPTPSQTELRRARGRCCAWPGPLLTTVELDTKVITPESESWWKDFQ